jgi:hypothetical protein
MNKYVLGIVLLLASHVTLFAQQSEYYGVIAKRSVNGLTNERAVKFTVFIGDNAPTPIHSMQDDCTDIQINIPESLRFSLLNNEIVHFENEVLVMNDFVKQRVTLHATAYVLNTSLIIKCNYNNTQYTCVLKEYKQ